MNKKLASIAINISFFFSALLILPACKSVQAPKIEVPRAAMECTSVLCRTVSLEAECEAAGGIWSETRAECLSTLEYERYQCLTSGKEWNIEDEKCKTDTESESTDSMKNIFELEEDETDVNIEIDIVD
jgi:hypothetical protein